MDYKTHAAVGTGLVALLLPTNDLKVSIVGTTLAIVGSLVVDIDTEKSKGSQFLNSVSIGGIVIVALGVFFQSKYGINILKYITKNKAINDMIPALLILIVALIIGKVSSHRGFTHSLIGIAAYTVPVYMIVGSSYIWFLVGYIAHLLADMLNYKEVKIFYPSKNGICLNLCSSDGLIDRILFISFVGITILKYVSYFKIIV